LTPESPLPLGVILQVTVSGPVRDLLGNPSISSTLVQEIYRVDSGRFTLPERVVLIGEGGSGVRNRADIDLDGKRDLIISRSTTGLGGEVVLMRLERIGPGGNIGRALELPSSGCLASRLPVADVDADGRLDILEVATFCGLHWIQQLADGSFARRGAIDTTATDVGVLRLVGQARPGLVVVSGSQLRLLRPSGASGFADAEVVFTADVSLESIEVADLNGDGRDDVALIGQVGGSRNLIVATQRADGGFDTRVTPMPTALRVKLAADATGDGLADLVISEIFPSTRLLLLQQTATGELAAPVNIVAPFRAIDVRITDFDGNGQPDLAISNSNRGEWPIVAVLLRTATGYNTDFPLGHGPPSEALDGAGLEIGDFDGDSRLDILLGQFVMFQRATAGPSRSPIRALKGVVTPAARN
jgi:hypothetical protein